MIGLTFSALNTLITFSIVALSIMIDALVSITKRFLGRMTKRPESSISDLIVTLATILDKIITIVIVAFCIMTGAPLGCTAMARESTRQQGTKEQTSAAIKQATTAIVEGINHLANHEIQAAISSLSNAIESLQNLQRQQGIEHCEPQAIIDACLHHETTKNSTPCLYWSQTAPRSVADLLFEALIRRSRARSSLEEWPGALLDGQNALSNAATAIQLAAALDCQAIAHAGSGDGPAATRAQAEADRLRAELEAARLAKEERLAREREEAHRQRLLQAERAAREAAAAKEARRAAAFRAAAAAYAERVDTHIRARRDFDGADPTALWVPLGGIDRACPRDPTALPGPLADALCGAPAVLEVDAAGRRVRLRRLTPHRGDGRVFGEFRCARCGGRWWCSGHTFADAWQKCRGCETPTYPFAQRPLDPHASGADGGPPHDQARCGMCQRLGRLCTPAPAAPPAFRRKGNTRPSRRNDDCDLDTYWD
jgi:hypothetical protein